MTFEVNEGQVNSEVKFLSRGAGYNLLLTSNEAVLELGNPEQDEGRSSLTKPQLHRTPKGQSQTKDVERGSSPQDVVRMRLIDADPKAQISGLNELPGKSNYFIGNDPKKWRKDVAHYAGVQYKEVYDGVDLIYYGNQRQLEYDFVVAPGANPGIIRFAFKGSTKIDVDEKGSLVLHLPNGVLKQGRPLVYQVVNQLRKEVSGRYLISDQAEVSFDIGPYDPSKPLIIDPAFVFSTYLGGTADDVGLAITIDSSGNSYVTGRTLSTNFLTANTINGSNHGLNDVFVTKINPAGNSVLYTTFIGGSGDEAGYAIAINSAGQAYVTGYTKSTNFPLVGALQPFYGGGSSDAFLFRLSANGNALVTSSYAGGNGEDVGTGIALDSTGNIYGIGYTSSTDLQTINSIQPFNAGGYDAYVLKLSPTGNSILFSTYVGGTGDDFGNAIAVDSLGYVYAIGDTNSTNLTTVNALQSFNAGGFDAFLAKLTPSGTNIVFSTYAGGNGDDSGSRIALDGSGNIYAVGYTNSTNFPLITNAVQPNKAAGYDAFIAKLNTNGTTIFYSTFLGGNSSDAGYDIAIDSAGSAYIIGETSSTDFPLNQPLQSSNGGARDVFVTKLSPTGSTILFSTYLGGSADESGYGIAADGSGRAYLTGRTTSTNFPTANPVQLSQGGSDAFIASILTTGTPTPTPTPTPSGSTLQFSQSSYFINEGAGHIVVTITRTGELGASSVDYRTADTDTFTVGCSDTVNNAGGAYGRCDYSTSVDTLNFAPGETTKTFSIPIIDDSLAEGNETFSIVLSNVTGGTLGIPATATITINDNDTVIGPNPIFNTAFFVREHYLDFLSREPEIGEPWTAVLNNCSDVNNNPLCDRLTVSAAFFGSPEFQLKGYFVYRFYKLAFNRLPTYPEIVTDMRAVAGQTPAEVFLKKAAFTNDFAQRAEFTAAYGSMTPAEYVSALMGRYSLTQITTPDPAAPDGTNKVTLTTADLTNRLNASTLTRAQVLRAIADSDQVSNLEFNQAFVAMQYYGYLRRAPDTAGYNSWLTYLNSHPTDSRTMVNGFMNSNEYRLRFGGPNQ